MVNQLNRLLKKNRTRLVFHADLVSELNAAKGLIEILKLRPGNFRILRHLENSSNEPGIFEFDIQFDFNLQHKLKENSLILNHEPYKYFAQLQNARNDKNRSKKEIGLAQSQKLIVFTPTHPQEIKVVLKAYQQINLSEKPLLVIALRIPNHRLVHLVNRMGLKAINRNTASASRSQLGQYDVVMLNTMGELGDFYEAADLALMGHDRNLFEPAALGIPILYFKEPLKIGAEAKKMLDLFGLAWRKNKIGKQLLDRCGAAMPIEPQKLSGQMTDVLKHPQKMIRGTKIAVSELRKSVIPFYRFKISKLLLSKLLT